MTPLEMESLRWDEIERLISRGVSTAVIMSGDVRVEVFFDAQSTRLGIRVPCSEALELQSPFREVSLALVNVAGVSVLQVATGAPELYREFVTFSNRVIERIRDGQSAPDAVLDTLRIWRELTSPQSVMSEEMQIGLWGELWVLDRLIESNGPAAVASWIGPKAEPHDFRLHQDELEVKTTRSVQRVHLINGVQQLTPTPDYMLHLVSIQVEPSGAAEGVGLPEAVTMIRSALERKALRREEFNGLLDRTGYQDQDQGLYLQKLQLRTKPRVIPVDSELPKIDSGSLQSILGDRGGLITDVRYRLNVEGLGYEEGTEQFWKLFPRNNS